MKFYVWYLTREHFRDADLVTKDNIVPSHYHKVGEVEATDLEHLFRRMNLVDGSECEVVGRGPGKLPIRSLSVGDVAVDETGRGYLCAMVGWEPFDASHFR